MESYNYKLPWMPPGGTDLNGNIRGMRLNIAQPTEAVYQPSEDVPMDLSWRKETENSDKNFGERREIGTVILDYTSTVIKTENADDGEKPNDKSRSTESGVPQGSFLKPVLPVNTSTLNNVDSGVIQGSVPKPAFPVALFSNAGTNKTFSKPSSKSGRTVERIIESLKERSKRQGNPVASNNEETSRDRPLSNNGSVAVVIDQNGIRVIDGTINVKTEPEDETVLPSIAALGQQRIVEPRVDGSVPRKPTNPGKKQGLATCTVESNSDITPVTRQESPLSYTNVINITPQENLDEDGNCDSRIRMEDARKKSRESETRKRTRKTASKNVRVISYNEAMEIVNSVRVKRSKKKKVPMEYRKKKLTMKKKKGSKLGLTDSKQDLEENSVPQDIRLPSEDVVSSECVISKKKETGKKSPVKNSSKSKKSPKMSKGNASPEVKAVSKKKNSAKSVKLSTSSGSVNCKAGRIDYEQLFESVLKTPNAKGNPKPKKCPKVGFLQAPSAESVELDDPGDNSENLDDDDMTLAELTKLQRDNKLNNRAVCESVEPIVISPIKTDAVLENTAKVVCDKEVELQARSLIANSMKKMLSSSKKSGKTQKSLSLSSLKGTAGKSAPKKKSDQKTKVNKKLDNSSDARKSAENLKLNVNPHNSNDTAKSSETVKVMKSPSIEDKTDGNEVPNRNKIKVKNHAVDEEKLQDPNFAVTKVADSKKLSKKRRAPKAEGVKKKKKRKEMAKEFTEEQPSVKEDPYDEEDEEIERSQHCKVCNQELKSVDELQSHTCAEQQELTCVLCDQHFKLKPLLIAHIVNHFVEKNVIHCRYCGRGFKTLFNCRRHEANHKDGAAIICKVCSMAFESKEACDLHERVHSLKTLSFPYVCPVCSKVLPNPASYARHEKIHWAIKPHKCRYCSRRFTEKQNCITHQRRHFKDRPFHCEHCPAKFYSQGEKIVHQKIHSGEKNYQCMTCKKCFRTDSILRSHLLVHLNLRPFKCEFCHKGFKRKRDCEIHVRGHYGIKPFACEICDKTFTSRGNLNQHHRLHESLENSSLKCKYCDRHFRWHHSLSIHENWHERLQCRICSMQCKNKNLLSKHEQEHLREALGEGDSDLKPEENKKARKQAKTQTKKRRKQTDCIGPETSPVKRKRKSKHHESQINTDSQLNTGTQIKSDSQIDADQQVNTNSQLNAERQINTESQLNTDTQINTNSQLNTDTQINTESQLNTDTQINTDSQLNTDTQINTNSQIATDCKVNNSILMFR